MLMIYKVVKGMITNYINGIIDDAYKKEKNKTKNMSFFLDSVSVYINTIDHIKETLGNVNDLIITLLEAPYNEQVEFSHEEETCLELINELIVMIRKVAETSLENVFNQQFAKVAWDRFDISNSDTSKYVHDIIEAIRPVVDLLRGKVGVLHLTKILNNICQTLIQKYVAAVLKLKKVSDGGVNQLQRDFVKLRQELENMGKNEEGEPISKIYSKFVQTTSEKATKIIQLLAVHNIGQIQQDMAIYKDHVSVQEMEKILGNKGFKKSEISNILSAYDAN
jgi:RINT-1 / TIP-1 family